MNANLGWINIRDLVNKIGLDMCLQSGNELIEEAIDSGYNALSFPFKINFEHSREKFNLEYFKKLMENCVHKVMQKCKGEKIGITFSGGVDSVMLGWLFKTLYPEEDIVAYHSYFNDPVVDELDYAKRAAKFIGIPLVVVDTGRQAQLAYVKETAKLCSTLTVGIIHMSILGKAMADDGVQHVMWGLGAGEFIGGASTDNRWYNRGIKSKLRLYPFANTKLKWDRYVALLFGTDKAYLVNKLMKTPSKRYVKDVKYSVNLIYENFHGYDLWSSLKMWAAFMMVGKQKSKIDSVRAYGMTTHFPFIEETFTNYCYGLKPTDVYNKQMIRDWMVDVGFDEDIAMRGSKFEYGGHDKAGLSPSDSFYDYDYVKHIVPKNYESSEIYNKYFSNYTKKNMDKWMRNADRRAIQIGLFLRMMKHRIKETD